MDVDGDEERSNKKRAHGDEEEGGMGLVGGEEEERREKNGERVLVHRRGHRHTRAWLLILSLRVLFSFEKR